MALILTKERRENLGRKKAKRGEKKVEGKSVEKEGRDTVKWSRNK